MSAVAIENILIRSGKNPFEKKSAEETLRRNVLGTNSGNLIFAHSVFKSLSVEGAKLTSTHRYSAPKTAPEEISEEYDAFVLPLANAFRPSFLPSLNKYTEFIDKLSIPVIVAGVGAQGSLDYDTSRLKDCDKGVHKFVKAVLKKSASIGVRGECTYNYLRGLGFGHEDIDIIGCPSMFLNGAELKSKKKKKRLSYDSNVAINISPYVPKIAQTVEMNRNLFENLTYIPQNNESLEQLLWGAPESLTKANIPHNIHHPMYVDDKIRFFIDPTTWIDFLRDYDFSFGTRIHGTVMSILAGTPAFLIAHDSRTLELAEYFEIPHARYDSFKGPISALELFERTDNTKMQAGHAKRFDKYVEFLNKNGLPNVFSEAGDGGLAFEKKVSAINFPRPVTAPSGASSLDAFLRMGWMNKKLSDQVENLKKQMKLLQK